MFMDSSLKKTSSAPAERNLPSARELSSAGLRPYGADDFLHAPRAINISPPGGPENKKILQRCVHGRLLASFFWLLLSACFSPAFAQSLPQPSSPLYGGRPENGPVQKGLPKALQEVGIDQKLGQQLPLDLVLRDENGQEVKLGQYFGKRPVVLSLVYYSCPMLCTQVLNGMVGAFKTLSFVPGEEYEVITVSFDTRETPALAAAKKATYVNYLPATKRAAASNGWHFLTGDEATIKRLTDGVGFRYHWDEATNQFAHASGIMVLTPEGKLAQYYYGIEYSARDLRLGLVEASANRIGSPVDQLLLYCYHYDPATGTYGAVVMNMVRLGGILTVIAIVGLILMLSVIGSARMRLRAGGAVN